MHTMNLRWVGLLIMVATSGCECILGPSDGCGPARQLTILQTAPAEKAKTGRQQKFGVKVKDSFEEPESISVKLQADGQAKLDCEYSEITEQSIDGDRTAADEYIFYCPVKAAELPAGDHNFVYEADGAGHDAPIRKSVVFFHDVLAPTISARVEKGFGANILTWDVNHERDFDRVSLFVNQVRVTTSYMERGKMRLDDSVRGPGAHVELRAYDRAGNDSATVVELK